MKFFCSFKLNCYICITKGKVRADLNLNPFHQHTMGLDIYFKAKSKNEKLRKEYEELDVLRRDIRKRQDDAIVREIKKIRETNEPNQSGCYVFPQEVKDRLRAEFENEAIELQRKIDECYDALYSEVAYFRKVNFLLPYFNYEENCSEVVIDKCEVEELIDDCKRVINAKDTDIAESIANELLPTEAGFFFGNTDYDEWYFKDVQEVMDKFTEILNDFDFDENELIMDCWW